MEKCRGGPAEFDWRQWEVPRNGLDYYYYYVYP
jgi:hypothetical protein